MTSELETAIARHAEAEKASQTAEGTVRKADAALAKARQATAEARAALDAAKAHADDLMARAAKGEAIAAATLVAARDAVTAPAAALELAQAAETPAREALTRAAGVARQAQVDLDHAAAILHRQRRIEAAHRLDETVMKAREIIAELAALGPHDATHYHLHLSRQPVEVHGIDGDDLHRVRRPAAWIENQRPGPQLARQ